ncbi:pentapeptide repeat-containing protein [Agromyces silvae]|uniref:pentapeptide repeat-containing protein n=1 Tax=Agromyces silvae TaxID=3388266 RepID=UPI00359F9CDA
MRRLGSCRLRGAWLRGARLRGARLRRARLRGAGLRGARLRRRPARCRTRRKLAAQERVPLVAVAVVVRIAWRRGELGHGGTGPSSLESTRPGALPDARSASIAC